MTKGLLSALCIIFVVTLIVFPGLSQASGFKFLANKPGEAAWLNFTILTAFNVFDTLGRYLGGVKCMILSRIKIIVLSYLRSIQLAIFLMIAFEVRPVWLFGSDWFKLFNFSLFAFSNGYLNSLCSIKAPEVVKSTQDRGKVGKFMGLARFAGILIGSTIAMPLKEVIKLTPSY